MRIKNMLRIILVLAGMIGCFFQSCQINKIEEMGEAPPATPREGPDIIVRYRNDVFPDKAYIPILRGYSWADERDNFQHGKIFLSGMTKGDNDEIVESGEECFTMAKKLCYRLIEKSPYCNTIRVPINRATMADPEHRKKWFQMIDGIVEGAKLFVVIAYWPDGRGLLDVPYGTIEEGAWRYAWWPVVGRYKEHERVYFEPINEPWGYGHVLYGSDQSVDLLKDIYSRWISEHNFTVAQKHRVILAGSGVEEKVYEMGTDSRFDDCLLGYHMYYFVWNFNHGGTPDSRPVLSYLTRRTQWPVHFLRANIGSYIKRTVVTEFGITMNDATDYDPMYRQPGNKISYYYGICEMIRTFNMGAIYWNASDNRKGTYGMFTGDTPNIINNGAIPMNNSGYLWLEKTFKPFTSNYWSNVSPDYAGYGRKYKFTNAYNKKVLGVRNDKWVCLQDDNGSDTQRWEIDCIGESGIVRIKNIATNKYLEISGASVYSNSGVDVWDWNEGHHQQWLIQHNNDSEDIVSITSYLSNYALNNEMNLSLVRRGDWDGVAEDCTMGMYDVTNDEYNWKLEKMN